MTRKRVLDILIIALIVLAGFVLLYLPVIFQEGNPWPQIQGIVKLTFRGESIIQLSASDNKYMTRSRDAREVITKFMAERDYQFVEQLGSGYLFRGSTGQSLMAVHRFYTRYYSLWTLSGSPEGYCHGPSTVTTANNIAAELRECLPKSDQLSHEKCTALLQKIVNFEDCVNAGFSILKSNPPQCATPDGRSFTQETNATWDMVVSALCGCEVSNVFQSHARIVRVELKDGRELVAIEPIIDDIMYLADEIEPQCGRIILSTE